MLDTISLGHLDTTTTRATTGPGAVCFTGLTYLCYHPHLTLANFLVVGDIFYVFFYKTERDIYRRYRRVGTKGEQVSVNYLPLNTFMTSYSPFHYGKLVHRL